MNNIMNSIEFNNILNKKEFENIIEDFLLNFNDISKIRLNYYMFMVHQVVEKLNL